MPVIPVDTSVYRIVWSGTYGTTPEEIFAYGRWAYSDLDADMEGILDTVETDVTDMLAETVGGSTPFTNIGNAFPSDVKWTLVKVHKVNAASGEMLGESHMRELTDAGTGAEGNGLPYQMTMSVTAEAAFPDRKRRSRFFLPRFVHNALNGHGRVLPDLIDAIQTQLVFKYNANKIATVPVTYCTLSKGLVANNYEIDRFYTGDVIDTQRRRRNKLPEVRHVLTVS